VKVVMTEEAQRQARAERRWWRAHRDAKQLFNEELRAARSLLAKGTKHEIYGYFDGQPVRRFYSRRPAATCTTSSVSERTSCASSQSGAR